MMMARLGSHRRRRQSFGIPSVMVVLLLLLLLQGLVDGYFVVGQETKEQDDPSAMNNHSRLRYLQGSGTRNRSLTSSSSVPWCTGRTIDDVRGTLCNKRKGECKIHEPVCCPPYYDDNDNCIHDEEVLCTTALVCNCDADETSTGAWICQMPTCQDPAC